MSSDASNPTRSTRLIGALALVGVLFAAVFGAAYLFRERLFLLAFERKNLPAMRFLLALDSRLANGSDPGVWQGPGSGRPMAFLARAAHYGEPEIVALLLSRGADPNANSHRALQAAVFWDRIAIVQMLLDGGVDIRAGASSALAQAAHRGNKTMLTFLLDKGAPIEAGDRALATAATYGHWDIAAFLWERGAPREALSPEDRQSIENIIRARDEASRADANP
jgi:hypothetical protein